MNTIIIFSGSASSSSDDEELSLATNGQNVTPGRKSKLTTESNGQIDSGVEDSPTGSTQSDYSTETANNKSSQVHIPKPNQCANGEVVFNNNQIVTEEFKCTRYSKLIFYNNYMIWLTDGKRINSVGQPVKWAQTRTLSWR